MLVLNFRIICFCENSQMSLLTSLPCKEKRIMQLLKNSSTFNTSLVMSMSGFFDFMNYTLPYYVNKNKYQNVLKKSSKQYFHFHREAEIIEGHQQA